MRLDKYLVENNYFDSRNKASESIKKRNVLINDKIIDKPSFEVESEDKIEILENYTYVSRAAYKLKEFLKDKNININIKDKECLDIGSSTGGFTEVLLEYEAMKVTCVDVGKNQLHPKLRENIKIELKEECDIRRFNSDKKYELVTCDLSFISISAILDKIIKLSNDKIILLFKPQFEVGKNAKRNKKGVVKDKNAIERALRDFESSLVENKLKIIKKEESKIKGKEGNIEYFYYIQR